jgi:anaerobic ribonucleoside-triphosphate reductase activating protein
MKSTSDLSIRISRIHQPVSVLGFGRRIGIWTQGCSIGCAGCVSVDTWDPKGGTRVSVRDLVDQVGSLADDFDGITISGGEPFDQPEPLARLLDGLHGVIRDSSRPMDLLAYSGRNMHFLRRRHQSQLDLLDAVIAGPYIESLPSDHAWFGSRNQKLVALSALGNERYGEGHQSPARKMQIQVDPGGSVWMIGVPRSGDMPKIEAGLARRGIQLEGSSWLS